MFSIVIPALNEWYYLNMTLDSIYNNVDSDLLVDIVVVDDCSDRENYDYLETHPLKDKIVLIQNETRKWPSYSRNIWAENAKGGVLIFIDAHMYCYDFDLKKLKWLWKYLEKWAIQGTVGNMENKQALWWIYKIKDYLFNSTWDTPKKLENGITKSPAVAWGFTIMKKETFNHIGWFNKMFNSWGVEDLEISLRLCMYWYETYYTDMFGLAHYFKKSFNYEVKTGDVLYNKYLMYKLYFEDIYVKSEDVINKFENHYWKESLDKTIEIINNNKDISEIIKSHKDNFVHDINWYFFKFNEYYNEIS